VQARRRTATSLTALCDELASSGRSSLAVGGQILLAADSSPHNGGWVIQLEHEASHGFVFEMGVPRMDADATIKRVAEWLATQQGELRRIATAPLLENADDVMEIRALSHIFNWTRLEVKSVVQLIRRWTLSDDEAEWLIASIGRDGPAPTPSWEF
jgi:hypothetical protein